MIFSRTPLRISLLILCLIMPFQLFSSSIDSLENSLDTAKPGATRIIILNTLSESYLRIRDFNKSQHYGERALKETEVQLKSTVENTDDYQKLKALEGIACNNLGKLYGEKSDFKNAMLFTEKAFAINEKLHDKAGMAESYNNLGNIALYQSNYPESMNNFLLSLKLRNETGDKKGIAASYNNLGSVSLHLENYQEALKYFKLALPIRESLGDKKGVAKLYNAIGTVYGYMDQSEDALRNFNEALKLQTEIGDQQAMAQLYNNMGVICTAEGNYENALLHFRSSLKIKELLDDRKGIANTLNNIGTNYLKQKDYKSALAHYERSLSLAKEINNLETIKENYKGLSETYASKKDFEIAYQFHLEYITLKDSLLNGEKNLLISEMRTKFETEKKDQEIRLLDTEKKLQQITIEKQKASSRFLILAFSLLVLFSLITFYFYNQKRKTAFERRVSQVEMTALRAQMNPHFIFNSLNSIHKYIQSKEPSQASAYLIKFSKLMRLILENSRFQEVSVEKDLQALELYMQLESLRMNNRFSYEMVTDPGLDCEITLIPPLLLQPFVENAIWHGLQGKTGDGLIRIGIKKDNDMLVCSVEDNGIGRVKAKEMKKTAPDGKHESLGMKITDARIEIINKVKKSNASVLIQDLEQGVRVEVRIPLELSF
jgi:tetratricopeptide (TPR) repeat protein